MQQALRWSALGCVKIFLGSLLLAACDCGGGGTATVLDSGPKKCTRNDDCAKDPNGLFCVSGACVMCAADKDCPEGKICESSKCTPRKDTPCKVSTDCPAGAGVCRNGVCTQAACEPDGTCPTGEICVEGKCKAGIKGTYGRTLAAGGVLSKSSKHIHLGLTGQGRAVGSSTSSGHKHTTGATSVMQR
jgi:Cys-rich repeat protein